VRGAISRFPHESLQSEVARGGVEPPTFRFSDGLIPPRMRRTERASRHDAPNNATEKPPSEGCEGLPRRRVVPLDYGTSGEPFQRPGQSTNSAT